MFRHGSSFGFLAAVTVFVCAAVRGIGADSAAATAPADPLVTPTWFREVMSGLNSGPSRAREEAERRLAEARTAGNSAEAIYSQIVIGAAYARRNLTPQALEVTAEALAGAEKIAAPALLIAARNARAMALRSTSDFASALEVYLLNLSLIEKIGGGRENLEVLNGIVTGFAFSSHPLVQSGR